MGCHQCLQCYRDTIEGIGFSECLHQREVLKNPYYENKDFWIHLEKDKYEFFERLKDFSLPITL